MKNGDPLVVMQGPTRWQLVREGGERPVKLGAKLKTFRNEAVTLIGGRPPHKPESSGRVLVSFPRQKWTQEFYPSVVGCEWKEA